MSDGCLSKSGRNKNRYTVRICSNDFDIIEWLHTYMCVGNKIYKQGQNGFVIQFRNECSIKFMMDYGLKERKSLDAVFPDIPDDFLGDFIRGYFDGNGSMVLQRTRYNTYAQVSFTSGSKKFLDALKDRLSQHDIASHIYKDGRSTNGSYYLRIIKRSEIEKFFSLVYQGNENEAMLQRKYKKFLEYLDCKPKYKISKTA